MGCGKSKAAKLQDRGIMDQRTEVNFGILNNQSNNEGTGMSALEVVEVVSFGAIFLLLARCFYQHCAVLASKMTTRQQNILQQAGEMGTRATSVSIPMPGPTAPPTQTLAPIYSQPVGAPRQPKIPPLPGYTDYGA